MIGDRLQSFFRGKPEKVVDETSTAPRPSLNELYKLYGYTSPEAQRPPAELTAQPIEISAEEVDIMSQTVASALDSFPNTFSTEAVVSGIKFKVKVVPTDGAKYFEPAVLVQLIGQDGLKIADFNFMRTELDGAGASDCWALYHRFISDKYRGQDIGSKMLQVVDKGLQTKATKVDRMQTMEIDAHQLGVINLALKSGYQPATREDQASLDLIYKGDKSKILITTGKGHFHEKDGGGDIKPGFIYSVKHLQEIFKKNWRRDLTPEEIWAADLDRIFHDEPKEYLLNALKVKFKKEIKPLASGRS